MSDDPDPDLAALRLVDHHCHGLVRRDLDRPGFEAMLTEAAGPAVATLMKSRPEPPIARSRPYAPLIESLPLPADM